MKNSPSGCPGHRRPGRAGRRRGGCRDAAPREPFRGYQGADQLVDIPQGLGTNAIGQRLVDAGVVRDSITYRLALWSTGDARRLQAGEYRFDHR
jgi:hypothetical protein